MSAVEDNVPSHTLESLSNYIIHGWEPGGFLESMLGMANRIQTDAYLLYR